MQKARSISELTFRTCLRSTRQVWIAAALMLLVSVSVFAGVGNTAPQGPHYGLNIVGVKNVGQIGDSNGHTIFVPLNGPTKIYMKQGTEFRIDDRNALDGSGSFTIGPGEYRVFAAALGKPNGNVEIIANGIFTDAAGTQLLELGTVDLSRTKGKPVSVDITPLFKVTAEFCIAEDAEGNCTDTETVTNKWVFSVPYLVEYFWDYLNGGMKLLQVRFYQV